MAKSTGGPSRSPRRPVTRLLDDDGRVRAILHCKGDRSQLVFYDRHGRKQQTVRGLLAVSTALFRMLDDPGYHPELAGRDPPVTVDELLSLPPPLLQDWLETCRSVLRGRAKLRS